MHAIDSSPLPSLPPRRPDSHKGDFGRALLIGGSQGMAGAIALAGMATLRSGAGLVKLATPSSVLSTVASFEPSFMTMPLDEDSQGRIAAKAQATIVEAAKEATTVALGPGLGRSPELVELVGWLYQNLTQPMVVDADALYALAQQPAALARHAGPRILTPHPGEFARLINQPRIETDQRQSLALDFAKRNSTVLLLKGHQTIVTDGGRLALNHTGNPGMATGGSGDVLTGIITALVCQGLSPFDAARLGAHVHGMAGDLAADELGQVAMIASDLVRHLPQAWQQLA